MVKMSGVNSMSFIINEKLHCCLCCLCSLEINPLSRVLNCRCPSALSSWGNPGKHWHPGGLFRRSSGSPSWRRWCVCWWRMRMSLWTCCTKTCTRWARGGDQVVWFSPEHSLDMFHFSSLLVRCCASGVSWTGSSSAPAPQHGVCNTVILPSHKLELLADSLNYNVMLLTLARCTKLHNLGTHLCNEKEKN